MTRANLTSSLSLLSLGPRRPRIAALVVRFARVTRDWTTRRRTRQQLSDLDEHMLKDIGITQAQAAKEARRPFWQA